MTEETHSWNFFSKNGGKTDAEQKRGRRFTGAHSLAVLTGARPHRNAVKPQSRRCETHLVFRDSVDQNNYGKPDCGFDLSQAGALVNGPRAAAARHRWPPETSGDRSDPVLPSSGETVILSAPKKCPSQLPSVFTAASHQTFIKCHLYSV